MDTKQTFKEYLESKNQLKEFLRKPPIIEQEFKVKNFCKLATGKSLSEKTTKSLKPGSEILIKWKYIENEPVYESVSIDNNHCEMYWKPGKFKEWLKKNTKMEDGPIL